MQRAAWTVALGLWLATGVRAQTPAPLPLELRWEAPPECGTAADVQVELERIARAQPGHVLPPLRAQAHVVPEPGGGYAVQLSTEREGEVGERRLQAPDCPTLVRSVTLVLALAFGKDVEVAAEPAAATDTEGSQPAAANATQGAQAPDGPVPPTPPPPAAEQEPTSTTEAVTDGRARLDLRLALLLGAGAQPALLPEPSALGLLGVELAARGWSLGLRGTLWPATSARVGPELDARFDGLGGALEGCAVLGPDSLPLALCAVAQAAALRGRSEGAFEDGSDVAPWLALGPLLSGTWPGSGVLRVRISAALPFSLTRPRFVVAGFGPVHRVPLLSPELGLLLVLAP